MALALGSGHAATFTVTTTNDAGAGSLRAAITSANAVLGADTIRFNITGAGVRTITLASVLPTITDQVLIDGYTQPGSSVNTVGPGSNAVIRIELNGNNTVATGLTINTFHCYVRGLVINRFTTNSINIAAGADNARIQGNFIGTNATGTAPSGSGNGIVVFGTNSQIGGWAGEDRNQISGCTTSPAIRLSGASCTGTQMRTNNIGLSSDGTTIIGGVQVGLRAENGATQNTFGEVGCCYNQVAGCTNQGVVVADAATRLDIKPNYIWGNGGLGIDLANNGVTTNDLNDADSGPNNLINFPVLVNAMSDEEGRVYVDFTYNGTPSTWIRFDFYANANPDATHGEGQLWIGTRYFETSASGSDLFHATVGAWNAIPAGTMISCTATNEGLGATSEYAANLACTGQKFMVTNTNDVVNGDTSSVRNLMYNQGGDGVSLREAFLAANNNYDGWTANYIYFDLPGTGVQTMTPTSPLPALTTATNVMGITDPEYVNTPVVHLIGTSSGAGANGVVFDYGWGGIYGFSITGFGGNGITMNGTSNEVNYCHIGVAPNGTTCAGNGGAGVYVNNTPDTEIGNPWWPGSPNVISGNAAGGVIIDGPDAELTRVCNSRIGTNQAGTAAICSQPFGVSIRNGAHDNYIGSENATMENVISGHPQQGIIATGNGNEVSYSFIGTNLAGTAAIPNGLGGINMTGTDTWIHDNIISGNTGSGITLSGDAATVDANNIGTNKAGTAALPNTQYGVVVNAGNGAWIGDGLSPTRNIISGNTLDGIYLNSASTNDVAVRGNYIGLGADGTTMIANGRDGLRTNGANDVNLRLNVISGNVGHGVNVIGGDGMNLSGNMIGTDATGTLDRGNAMNGVTVNGSSNILVGTDIADPNIISGNTQHGIDLLGAGTTFPQIFGNHIGLNAAGTAAIPNTFHGINIRSGIGSGRIGAPGSLKNVISGNNYCGIFMQGPNGQDIRSNYIGTNAAGTVAVPNVQNGIQVSNAMSGLLVGGSAAGEGNLISGNGMNGIYCSPVTGTITSATILGNTIGLNAAGNAALPNVEAGILLGASCNTFTIGGTTAAARNVISGNGEAGLELLGATITVHGNYIGTDATGTIDLGNTYSGINVQGTGAVIGSGAAGAGNIISGNDEFGIMVTATGCVIRGNRIGTNAAGTAALANGMDGVSLAASTTVGGTGANEGNLISGNTTSGIYGSSTNNCTIRGNIIGLNAAGTAAIGNGDAGIRLMNSNTCTIGGNTAAARNVVSGNGVNGFDAIYLGGGTGHTIQGNYIGTNAAGTASIGNAYGGISVQASSCTIGGPAAGAGNVISGNLDNGISLLSTGNTIQGNWLGTDQGGTANLGNGQEGIELNTGGNNNLIGGTGANDGNTIRNNGTAGEFGGVGINESVSGNRVLGNRIDNNTGLGINLVFGNVGPLANDAGDGDTGANARQNYPVLTSAVLVAGNITVNGTFNSTASSTFRIEFFSAPTMDPAGHGEGAVYLGTTNVTTDASGNAVINAIVPASGTALGHVVSSTATHSTLNNTSEFSNAMLLSAGADISGIVFEDVNYGGGAGRDRATALGNGGTVRPNTRVELFDGAGTYMTSTTTNASGVYTFSSLAPASYTVRVVNSTVSSARTGYVATLSGVQTFRTNASTGSAVAATDYVGGEVPNKVDAGNGSTTLAALTTATTTAQSIAPVTLGAANIPGVDFGFNFDVIVNVNNAGQGSLRQFMTNATTLGGDAALAQSGSRLFYGVNTLMPGFEASIFMIANGTAQPGLNTGYANLLTGGVAVITTTSALPVIGPGANANYTTIDATTQTVNVGNTNSILLGTGGPVGTQSGTLTQVAGPEVEVRGSNAWDGFVLNGNYDQLRGFSVYGHRNDLVIGGQYIMAQYDVFGASATSFSEPAVPTLQNNVSITGYNPVTITNNLIGFSKMNKVQVSWRNENPTYFYFSQNEVVGGPTTGNTSGLDMTSSSIGATTTGDNYIQYSLYRNLRDGITLNLDYPVAGPSSLSLKHVMDNTIRNNTGAGIIISAGDGYDYVSSNLIHNNTGGGVIVRSGNGSPTNQVYVYNNSFYTNGGLAVDLGAPGVTSNDGLVTAGADNRSIDYPVFTSATYDGSTLNVTGYVGSAPNQSAFQWTSVDVYLADDDGDNNGPVVVSDGLSIAHGEGRTFLGTLFTDVNGNFSGPVPFAVVAVGDRITALATNNVSSSEFSANKMITGPLQDISGTVFEDLNYGGGAGRDRSTALGNGGTGRPNARVELYDAAGTFVSATTTDASGAYTFSSLAPASYTVRVVNSTVSSARTGYVATLSGVQTFRTNAAAGSAVATTDYVGGEVPNKIDAGNGSTTLAALTTATTTAQSITAVTMGTSSITGVDFGFSFDPVVNTNDAGQGSYRQMIINANALGNDAALLQDGLVPAKENMVFMISNGTSAAGLRAANNYFSAGVGLISPATVLPDITGTIVINGALQPGFTTTPVVQLDGVGAGASSNGLHIMGAAGNSEVRGLIITRFSFAGVRVEPGAGGNTFTGTIIGTDAAGTLGMGNGTAGTFAGDGIFIIGGSDNNIIGGTTAADRNVISGNGDEGISVYSNNNIIIGNYVGTDPTGLLAVPNGIGTTVDVNGGILEGGVNNRIGGSLPGERNVIAGNNGPGVWYLATASSGSLKGNYIGVGVAGVALGNQYHGIRIQGSTNLLIGGPAAGEGNVISANVGNGIWIHETTAVNDRIHGNLIGVDPSGLVAMGNTLNGVLVASGANNNSIGASDANAPSEGNIIANNGAHGIRMDADAGSGNKILLNSIRDNGSLGIDLHNDGPTPNDASDPDTGANELQNYPVLTGAAIIGGNINIRGTLNSTPSTQYRVEFFSSPTADASGYGEGATFLGAWPYTTDASGNATINVNFSGAPPVGHKISSTATKITAGVPRSTSEFSGLISSTLPPVALCQNATLNLTTSGTATLTPAMIDNGSYDQDGSFLSMTISQSTFTCATAGSNTVTLTVTDSDGATATCTAVVTVVDNIAPVITCPANITLNANMDCEATATWSASSFTDNCAGGNIAQTAGPVSGSVFPKGITTITYTATDASGNTSMCSFTVTVVDVTRPAYITCPSNQTRYVAAGQCTQSISGLSFGWIDNCFGTVNNQISGTDLSMPLAPGVYPVSYRLTDAAGNQSLATCSFSITVLDTIRPTITCPANITATLTAGCNTPVSWTVPSFSDNCSATMAQTAGPSNGSVFPSGTTTVTYTATDASGNTQACSFTVTVVDATAPVIAACPNNISVNSSGACMADANWTVPTVSDNCSGATITRTAGPGPGNSFPVGTTTVTYTATDASGNTATCSFTVTVADVTAPVIAACPSNISVNAGASCTATATWTVPTFSDNCSGGSITRTAGPAPGSTLAIGSTTVAYTATDAAGNAATCSFTVTVVDVTAPLIAACPSNISVNAGASCTATATWTVPTFSDNCAGGSITRTAGPAPGSTFAIGSTTVAYTATDAAGNTATCSFTVTVGDVTAPVIAACPSNISVNAGASCTATATWTVPTFSDNCAGGSITRTAGPAPGSTFATGSTTVTYTATDAAGNTATCSFTVTVVDVTAPSIACPLNIIVGNAAGMCGAAVNYTAPTGMDNCSGVTTVRTAGPASGSTFPVGTTTITYQVTDATGLTASCSFTVTVNDTQAPVAVCQPVTIGLNGSGVANLVPAQVDGGSTDNCAITSMTVVPNSFNAVGTFSVTLTVFDAAGNSDDCTVNVTVQDNNAPTAVCQLVTIYVDATGNASIVAADIDGGSTDNGTIVSLVASQTAFDCSDLGANNVTLTVTDDGGNSDNCVAVVTVLDIIPPTAICQNITVQLDSMGAASITAASVDNGSSDNCAITSMSVDQTTFTCGDLGANTIVLTVTDASGNNSTCNATVTIQDNIAPAITCPANISVNNGAGICGAVVNYTAPVGTDNCGGSTTIRTAGLASGSTFPVGVNAVTYQVTDAAGNNVSCSFTITVTDVTAPVIVGCPSNISVNAGAGCTATATWTIPTFTDNCAGGTIALTSGFAPGSSFPIGTTTVTYTATDVNSNPATCSFTVTVVDVTAPVIVGCPSNISVNAGAGCTATATWTVPTFTDNCAGGSTALTAGLASGSAFPIGTNTVTYTATDAAGNPTTCSFTVTVVDVTAPAIACPANIVVSNDASICGAVVNYTTPVGTDNCSGVTTVMTAGLASGSQFPVGTTTVTYEVTDAAGLTASCSFTVTVNDTETPVATCQAVSVNLDGSGTATITAADVNNGSTDNCAIVSMTLSQYTFSAVGLYSVTLTVTDAAGNSDDCTVTATVTDNNPPIAMCQPVTIYLDAAGNATIVAADIDGGSTDNGTIVSLIASQTSFDCSDLGTNNVTLTVTDDGGNSDDCVAIVTVIDSITPTAVCQNISAYLDASGNVTITGADLNGGSSDNCGTSMLTYSASTASFDCSNLGPQTVTLTVTDASGNSSTCSATVTVQDTIAPTLACADATINVDLNGWAVITANAIATWSDNCSSGQSAWTSTDSVNVVGDTTIWVYVQDITGNIDSCSATVTISDSNPPDAVCQPVTIYLDAAGNATIVAADIDGGSTDNGTIVSLIASQTSFDCSDLGANNVTLTVTDDGGNSDDCIAVVTVLDTIAPSVACQDITIILDGSGNAGITSADITSTSSDNCGIGSLTFTSSTSSFSGEGTYGVMLTATDGSGNSSSCVAVVTVIDNTAPLAMCQPVTIYLDAAGNATIVAADIDGGSTDNGTIVSFVASQTSFNCSNLGVNNVTLTVTDDGGNSDDCIAMVTVLDTIAPTAVCQNINAYINASGNVTITGADLNGGSSDNCGTSMLTYSASTASFDCSNLGPQTVTLTVTDASGNSSMCSATVTVQDTLAPTLACADATINVDANGWAVITASAIATWSDNCSSGQSAWTSTDSVNVVGDTTIWVFVQDITSNIDSCAATVTISDNNPPIALCQPVTTYLDAAGNATIVAADIDGGSTDNGTIVSLIASQTSFDCSDLEANNVTLTVTDDGGNSDDCVAIVTVLDTIAPTLNCQPFTLVLDSMGQAVVNASDLVSVSSDNCAILVLTTDVSVLEHAGIYSVTVTASDAGGNSVSCTSSVTVIDTILPEANCLAFGGLLVYLDSMGENTIDPMQLDGGSYDNDTIVTYTASQTMFDCSNVGSNTVTLTVTDASGNTMSCTSVVMVMDTIAPTVICQNITLALDSAGTAGITGVELDGGTTDNCAGLGFSSDISTFNTVGSFTVILTVTDASGNSSMCSASVTVIDSIPPSILCQPATIYLDASGSASITAADIDGGSSDNVDVTSLTASQMAFDCSALGANNVTLIALDANGNSDSCIAVVTVLDTIAPNVVCQNITISLGENGTAIITGAQLNGGSSDNCGALTFTTSTNTFSSVGSYTVVLTVTDASGNSSTCTATVVVNDTDEPNALCQPTTIYLDENGSASIIANDIDGGSTDNGTIISIVASETDFGCDQLGENSVTLTIIDDQGNVSSCITVVTVLDTIAPTVSCQDITIGLDDNGVANIEAVQLNGGSADNCDSLSYSLDTESWTTTGSYEVTLIVTDASGNSSSCTAMVTVTSDRDDPLVIPSGFSPNGDGVGDNWVIQGLGDNAVVKVEIFNRWGHVVHSSGDYRNAWDGTCARGLGSDRLPDGTYFYVVEIADGETRTMNGYLQIAR